MVFRNIQKKMACIQRLADTRLLQQSWIDAISAVDFLVEIKMNERKGEMMEIRRAVKEDLPQINQLITDHPESFVKVKTAAELHDRNKLLIVAVTKRKPDHRFCASR